MKKYLIIAVVAMLIIGLVWYFVSKKEDPALKNVTEPTKEVKEAVIKKLGADYLAKKGKVRTYGESLEMIWGWWQNDVPNFKQYALKRYQDAGSKDFAEAIKMYIEKHANE